MSQKKKIKFHSINLRIAILLILLISFLGPSFVVPSGTGQIFYFFAAVLTAFMFPFMTVEDDNEGKS